MEAAYSEVATKSQALSVVEEIRGWIHTRFEFGRIRSWPQPTIRWWFQHLSWQSQSARRKRRKAQLYPAISLGFVARTNVQRVGGVLNNQDTHNEDFYIVGTKTITYFHVLPIVASFGFKATDGSVLGIAGNAPDWQGRLFGAAGFVVPGPVKSKVVFGSEFLQEPRRIEGLPGARLPTTLTYFARVIPAANCP